MHEVDTDGSVLTVSPVGMHSARMQRHMARWCQMSDVGHAEFIRRYCRNMPPREGKDLDSLGRIGRIGRIGSVDVGHISRAHILSDGHEIPTSTWTV